MRTITLKTFPRMAALAAVPLLALALVGCGSAAPEESPMSSPKASQMSEQEWGLAFAQCMRDEGLEYEDPIAGQFPKLSDDPAFVAASDACMGKIGQAPSQSGGGAVEKNSTTDQLELAKCLREHGVDVPDPKPGEGLSVPADVPDAAATACGVAGGGGGVTIEG